MQRTVLIAALIIGSLWIPFLVHAEFYKWVDDKGDVHFTDDYSKVPEQYRPVVETQRPPAETSPSSFKKEQTPALAPKVPEPEVEKTPSLPREVFEGVISKLDDFGRSFIASGEKETISFPISKDTKIIDEFGREVPFDDLTRRMSVTASGVPVSVEYIRDGNEIHTSTITIHSQKEFQWGDHRRPRPPIPPRPPRPPKTPN